MPSIRADELLRLAKDFRARAAEATDSVYHRMMMRTAIELEQVAAKLRNDRGEILLDEDDDGVEAAAQ